VAAAVVRRVELRNLIMNGGAPEEASKYPTLDYYIVNISFYQTAVVSDHSETHRRVGSRIFRLEAIGDTAIANRLESECF
jgi:hypothetical protein